MRWTARSGRETISRTITIRLLGARNVPVAPVQVLLAGPAARTISGKFASRRPRLVMASGIEPTFDAAANRRTDVRVDRRRRRRVRRLSHPRSARRVPLDEDRRSHLGPEADDRLAEDGRLRRPASVDSRVGPHPCDHQAAGQAEDHQACPAANVPDVRPRAALTVQPPGFQSGSSRPASAFAVRAAMNRKSESLLR